MMVQSLNKKELDLLSYCLNSHGPELVKALAHLNSGGLDSATINGMREAVGDELMLHGFKANSEPNEYGLELEDIIDRLGNLYLWPNP